MKDELRSITLVDQLEKKLLQYIHSEDLQGGDTLPSEQYFADKYNVSRNLVRESLSRLKMLNIIESRRKRGMVIKEPDPMVNFVKVVKPNLLSEESMLNLIELRCAMEMGIASMIFRNIKPSDIADLEEIVSREIHYDGVKVNVENEIGFHTRIYQIVNNQSLQTFQNVIIPIFSYVNSKFAEFNVFNDELRENNQLVTHADLLKRIKSNDLEGYKIDIENHLKAYINYVYARKQELTKK